MSIKSIIIDDDPFMLSLLQDKLRQYCPEVTVIGVASSGKEGLEKIHRLQPELVFLDVEMMDMTGFEMLSQLDHVPFQTIFITSYHHYAIKAIRFNALDYLVKPIDLGELKYAINRCWIKKEAGKEGTKLHVLPPANRNTDLKGEDSLQFSLQDGVYELTLKDIVHITGERNYSTLHLVGNKKKLISKTLSDFEELLGDRDFFRCHKSHLISAAHIISYSNRSLLILSNNARIPVSRRKKEEFRRWYESRKSAME